MALRKHARPEAGGLPFRDRAEVTWSVELIGSIAWSSQYHLFIMPTCRHVVFLLD